MTDEPQVALTTPPITHVWATTYESDSERKQRKVFCLRAEKGLSVTEVSFEAYTFTHIPSGKRIVPDDLTDKQALAAFDDVLALTDWTVEEPTIKRASLVALGLVSK
jgi:hypothetical protein